MDKFIKCYDKNLNTEEQEINSCSLVKNVKVKNIRPEFNNLKEWMNNKNNEYIGRKGVVFINKERFPKKDSIWANPFKLNKDGSREEILIKYETYIRDRLNNDNILKDNLLNLKNKNLGCWCYPELCHGNILLKLIEEYSISYGSVPLELDSLSL